MALSLVTACASLPQSAPAEQAAEAAKLAEFKASVAQARAKAQDIMSRARGPSMTLLAADLAFNDDAQARGLSAAFADRFVDDGKLIASGAPVAIGPAAVAKTYQDTDLKVEWAPMEAVVDGDLGVTWGIAALETQGKGGRLIAGSTRYVTVWKRQADGQWKIWIDTGASGPVPKPN
jgi:ketosteroid isomerase-like protein